jgi:NADPH-dependent ferric siderophore reductase
MFSVQVSRVRRLSPSFLRLTLTGPDLDLIADNGYDQRVKLILPLTGRGFGSLPRGEDWYSRWRLLPDEQRNPIRTYTIRHVRHEVREVDVDMVLHGPGEGALGPACAFALDARPGDELVLLGPDAAFAGVHGGLEFRPPVDHGPLLLAADETGVPAVANIVRALPSRTVGRVLLEVPHPDDRFHLAGPPGVEVSWTARGRSSHGAALLRMVCQADLPSPPAAPVERAPTAVAEEASEELLWDVPDTVALAESPGGAHPFYAWVAGEAATVRAIRRHLVDERGHDRRNVAFMGYWRMGRSEC